MAMVPRAFAALICAIAIGSFMADLSFLDSFRPFIVIPLSLLSFAFAGSLLVLRPAHARVWLRGMQG